MAATWAPCAAAARQPQQRKRPPRHGAAQVARRSALSLMLPVLPRPALPRALARWPMAALWIMCVRTRACARARARLFRRGLVMVLRPRGAALALRWQALLSQSRSCIWGRLAAARPRSRHLCCRQNRAGDNPAAAAPPSSPHAGPRASPTSR
eukprot:366009-Chlamydomonas_euryale.AAC.5